MLRQKQLTSNKIRTKIALAVGLPLSLLICEGINELTRDYQNFKNIDSKQAQEWFYNQSISHEERDILRESLYGMRGPDSTYLKLEQLSQFNQSGKNN